MNWSRVRGLTIWILLSVSLALHADESNRPEGTSPRECSSPEVQALLSAKLDPEPRENVWVLQAMAKLKDLHCPSLLRTRLYARWLERQELNKIMQEPVPALTTVQEAIDWESTVEYVEDDRFHGVTPGISKLRDRALTKALTLRTWQKGDPQLRELENAPGYRPQTPGIWADDHNQTLLGLVLTNQTQEVVTVRRYERPILFHARLAPTEPYRALFNCVLNAPYKKRWLLVQSEVLKPGETGVFGCTEGSGLGPRPYDAEWIRWINESTSPWYLTESDTHVTTAESAIALFGSPASDARAEDFMAPLHLKRVPSDFEKQVRQNKAPRLPNVWIGPASFLAGMVLVALLSLGNVSRMAEVAKVLKSMSGAATVIATIGLLYWGFSGTGEAGGYRALGVIGIVYILALTAGCFIGGIAIAGTLAQRYGRVSNHTEH